jgi:MFS family permease
VSEVEHAGAPKNEATGAADAVGVPGEASGARRMVNILAAVVVGVVLPVLLVGVLVGHFGASAMFIGLMWGALGAKLGGTRRMLYLAPAVGLAAGLGAGTAYGWWWVALLTVLGVIAGGGIGFGWLPPLLMLPFAAMFVSPESSTENAVIFGVIAGIGALYGVVLARRFGATEVVEGERQPVRSAILVAVVLGVALGGAAAIGVGLGWSEPYWVPEPILVLTLYILLGKRERVQEKAIGTALGVAAAIVVAILAPSPEVIAVIATVAFILALTQLKTYWLYYGLYTFALVLALAAPAQVGSEAKERGFEILAGIALLVVGLAIVHAVAAQLSKSDPQPELAPT